MKRILPCLLIVLSLNAAHAQESGAPSPLAGPKVEQKETPTLVRRDSDGSVRRTESAPELAAARLLELPREVLQKIDDIAAKRSRFLEKLIENNLDLLNKLDTAGQTGDKLDQARLGLEALTKLAPLTREGSLRKQVRALLSEEQQKKFDALLAEYWDAIVETEKSKDKKKSRLEILAGERFNSLAREVEAAFQRLEKSGTLLFHYFFHKVELTKEQETEIRTLLDEFVEESKGSPTKEQERTIFFAVMSRLTPQQQKELVEQFKGK